MNKCLDVIMNSAIFPNSIRIAALKRRGARIGNNVYVAHKVRINGKRLVIKDNSWIGYGSYITCREAEVSIGSNVGIASYVIIETDTHQIGPHEKRCGTNQSRPVKIEDGCWIGERTIICPGVTIHEGCVIAAGSVVTKDCEADCLYAGNPAIKKKEYGLE